MEGAEVYSPTDSHATQQQAVSAEHGPHSWASKHLKGGSD